MSDEEWTVADWIQPRLACVYGADGRGGTGIFMDMEDGRLALLTARHVVVDCILTGEMTVGRLDRPGRKSLVPETTRIDNSRDAACLIVDRSTFEGEAVPYSEWAGPDVEISKGMPVLVSGVVGEWKAPDTKTRHIPQTRILHLDTQVVDPDDCRQRVVCYVDEKNVQLPGSFKGMSGGPCVSESRRILGINTEELRRRPGTDSGEIFVTRLSHLGSLFKPMQPGLNDPTVRQQVSMDFWAVRNDNRGHRVRASVLAQFLGSRSTPDAPQGRTGRIVAMKIVTPPSAEPYVIQCCCTFTWSGGATVEDLRQTLEEELVFFLREMGFKLDSTVQFFDRT